MSSDQSGPLVNQHHRMAIKGGDPQENFSIENPFKQVGGDKPPTGTLKDSQRGISRPRGFHPEPDHG